jgi:hypothetical protein
VVGRAGSGSFASAKYQMVCVIAGRNCSIERRPPPRIFFALAGLASTSTGGASRMLDSRSQNRW